MAHRWRHKTPNTAATQARRRSYNTPEYRAAKAAGQRQVDAGHAHCWRCGHWLPPHQPWHLGHDDHNRGIIRGTECPPCNLTAAAKAGARAANQARRTTHHPTTHPLRW